MAADLPSKGQHGGECARMVCNGTPAHWFNRSTLEYYCEGCAAKLNRVHLDAAAQLFGGGPLCTFEDPAIVAGLNSLREIHRKFDEERFAAAALVPEEPETPPLERAKIKIDEMHRTEKSGHYPTFTPDELVALVEDACIERDRIALRTLADYGGEKEAPSVPNDFTCYKCSGAAQCPHAYDMYNTNGDCLASK